METQIVLIIVLILSVVLHEVFHGYAAWKLGDPTAKLQGRLSLNPLVHIDPIMSVLVPGILVLSGSPFLFGAAKPVPYNPYNFSDQKYGEAKVAVAGPIANILIAVVFGVLVQLGDTIGLSQTFVSLSYSIIVMNIFLALFNLLPIPPLDGSKILPIILPFELKMRYQTLRSYLEQNVGIAFLIIIVLVLYVLGPVLYSTTLAIARLLVGG